MSVLALVLSSRTVKAARSLGLTRGSSSSKGSLYSYMSRAQADLQLAIQMSKS